MNIVEKLRKSFFKLDNVTPYLIAIAFLIVTSFVFNDYGVNIDSKKNFLEGETNLNYLLTSQLDLKKISYQMHGSFSFMLAEASKKLFSDRLHLLDPVRARFLILPILISLFIVPFFYFVRNYFGLWVAFLSTVSLLTFPEFVGFAYHNLKDIPLLVFFSLTLISFFKWIRTEKVKHLYLFFMLFGISLSIKLYTLVIVLIICIVIFFSENKFQNKIKQLALKNKPNLFFGALFTLCLVSILYIPALYGINEKNQFLSRMISSFQYKIVGNISKPFNYEPFMMIVYKTPILMLFFTSIGLAYVLKKRKREIFLFLLIWVLIPPLLPCLPRVCLYLNGIRMFLIFLVPFSIIAALGVKRVYAFLVNKYNLNRLVVKTVLSVILLSGNLAADYLMHPYENLYFNFFVDGLKGAQEKGMHDSCDYWFLSFKEATVWLNKNAQKDASLYFVYGTGLIEPIEMYNSFELYEKREDLKCNRAVSFIDLRDAPKNSYIVYVPCPYQKYLKDRNALGNTQIYKEIRKVTRQGGEISIIYYKK